MGDHLKPIHFVFFQFGYDWQKYWANFAGQLEFRKKNSIVTAYLLRVNRSRMNSRVMRLPSR